MVNFISQRRSHQVKESPDKLVKSELDCSRSRIYSLIDDTVKFEEDLSSDDLPVVSVMPAMTLHEVLDQNEDTSSYSATFSGRDSNKDSLTYKHRTA